jgi:hypothetical protein
VLMQSASGREDRKQQDAAGEATTKHRGTRHGGHRVREGRREVNGAPNRGPFVSAFVP